MRASLLTRAGAAAAAGTMAITGVMVTAGAASATTTHKRLTTHLSVATRQVTVKKHRVTFIIGDLRSNTVALRGKTVFLDRVAGGKLTAVAHMNTNRLGEVAFVVKPKVTTPYVLVFKGSANFKPSRSRTVVVKGS